MRLAVGEVDDTRLRLSQSEANAAFHSSVDLTLNVLSHRARGNDNGWSSNSEGNPVGSCLPFPAERVAYGVLVV